MNKMAEMAWFQENVWKGEANKYPSTQSLHISPSNQWSLIDRVVVITAPKIQVIDTAIKTPQKNPIINPQKLDYSNKLSGKYSRQMVSGHTLNDPGNKVKGLPEGCTSYRNKRGALTKKTMENLQMKLTPVQQNPTQSCYEVHNRTLEPN